MKPHLRKKHSFFRVIMTLTITVFLLIVIDRQIMPKLKEFSHMQCRSLANQIIDLSAVRVINEMNLMETTLLSLDTEGKGYMANTVYINNFCTRFSEEITERMIHIPEERIEIPLGAITNLSFLADKGPKIPFTLLPSGAANVDYESDFRSVGINQINYKIWLDVSLEIKIINPLYQENIYMERKIMMADIVFSGKVPEQYFHMTPLNEYLLTE